MTVLLLLAVLPMPWGPIAEAHSPPMPTGPLAEARVEPKDPAILRRERAYADAFSIAQRGGESIYESDGGEGSPKTKGRWRLFWDREDNCVRIEVYTPPPPRREQPGIRPRLLPIPKPDESSWRYSPLDCVT